MTSISLTSLDPDFHIEETQLRSLLDFLALDEIYIVSGESGQPAEPVAGCGGFVLETPEDIFFESNVGINKAIELWLNGGAQSTVFILGCCGAFLHSWAKSLQQISAEIAGGFYPWDTSITLGPWETIDSDDEETIIARGNFKITKSDREYVPNPKSYLNTFLDLPETKTFTKLIARECDQAFEWFIE